MSAAAPVEVAQPRPLPMGLFAVAGALAGVGLLSFFLGLAFDPQSAWLAFHVNYLYFAGIAQGGLVIAAIFVIVGARWPGPVRRITEALAAWVPVTLLLGFVGIFGREYVYPWIEEPLPWKAAWLNTTRLYVVDLGIFAVLAVLTILFLRTSLRPTLRGAAESSTGFARGILQRWTAGWRGDAEERAASDRRLRVLAPIICLVYAFGYSIIGFDQVMSLTPTWFSNLFGAFFAWGAFLSAVSVTALLTALHRRYPGLEGEITDERLHDLGKMIFAFSIFWMYLFFSQYLVIWYGNLPEETHFIEARLGPEFLQSTWFFSGWWERIVEPPWVKVTLFAWICIWVVPFWFLLGRRPKRTSWFLAAVATVSAFGFWVERNVLVWPSLRPLETWSFLGWIQVGIALGFLGAFALTYLVFTRLVPSLPVPQR